MENAFKFDESKYLNDIDQTISDMEDLTFILPVRIESIIRLENFLAVLQFLRSTKSKIIVIEADNYTKDVKKRPNLL